MEVKKISTAALITSGVVAIVALLLIVIGFALFGKRTPEGIIFGRGVLWYILPMLVVVFMAGYTVYYYVLGKFVMRKIEPIYRVILSEEEKKHPIQKRGKNIDKKLRKLGGEINIWAETQRLEIAKLKDNERYRKEYVGNVSHELKTPIFNIQGYISTLLDGALEDSEINRNYLEKAEKSTDRLINIISELEEISKLEAGVLRLNIERFDLVKLMRDMSETLEMEATKKGVNIVGLSREQQPKPIFVKADEHHIGQVAVNLLSNSIKYGKQGGETKINFVDLFDKVLVEVTDNGQGIDSKDIKHIFERFYRTDKSRSRAQGGTGLGLSIVKHVIEAHNENITQQSTLGKGSTFAFTLPKA